jgi:SagB-type dehydrogenase family enzyme
MMKKGLLLGAGIILTSVAIGAIMFARFTRRTPEPATQFVNTIQLPEPRVDGSTSIEKALQGRRSRRAYKDEPLTLDEVSQLLWAAQGLTYSTGQRTAPSAGALYPLELYLLVGKVEGLKAGVYKYIPKDHALVGILEGDRRLELSRAALNQEAVQEAPAVMLIAAVYERTTMKYGERGERYVHMEVGSAAQNVYLQAESLNLGTVFIGAFLDNQVKAIVSLRSEEQPLCLMPIGKR